MGGLLGLLFISMMTFKASFYDGTWEGGWGVMSIQGGEVIPTYDKVV
jgi:hypothetical protein